MQQEEDKFVFDDWAEKAGFQADSIDKLKRAALFSERAIAGLREDELLEVKLSLGDRSILRDEWAIIRFKVKGDKHTGEPEVDGSTPGPESTGPSDPLTIPSGSCGQQDQQAGSSGNVPAVST